LSIVDTTTLETGTFEIGTFETRTGARRLPETLLPLPPRLLAALAIEHARTARFADLAEPKPGERTSARVHYGATHDIWLIRWGMGSRTELHDHGGSAGALYVVRGELVERRADPVGTGRSREHTLDHRAMSANHVHEIVNVSTAAAASVHVYSPPLSTMQHYEVTAAARLRAVRRELIDP
jgi:predicted metal-dependent enzyme (double-stranded beta helix superfamily)